jgi:hypothetical protein
LEAVLAVLNSPRRRRQLAWSSTALIPIAAVVGLILWNPGGVEPLRHENEGPPGPEPRQVVERPLPVTPAIRREVGATVESFVRTAVVRRNLDRAWSLASPAMREGVSRRDWRRGDLPVQPYPERALQHVDWSVAASFDRTVVVEVMVMPKERSGEPVLVYEAALTDHGRKGERRWLVDSWIPRATLGTATPPAARGDGQGGRAEGEEEQAEPQLIFDDARLSSWWFLLPAFFLALLVLTPLFLVVRGALAHRRAEREYRSRREP